MGDFWFVFASRSQMKQFSSYQCLFDYGSEFVKALFTPTDTITCHMFMKRS